MHCLHCHAFQDASKSAGRKCLEVGYLCTCAAPQIFLILGMGQKASLLGILIVSGVNLLATILAIYAVDRQAQHLNCCQQPSSVCHASLTQRGCTMQPPWQALLACM